MPAVTAAQMREVDRIAVEEFGLGVLQMMENAGRNLAHHVMQMLGETASVSEHSRKGQVIILAGAGGNGGGGLCSARHLHNRGYHISPEVYLPLGLSVGSLFGDEQCWIRLRSVPGPVEGR